MDEVVSMHPAAAITFEHMPDVWTFDDVRRLDVPDWWRYEIVDGSLVVSPSASPLHEFVSEEVRAAIRGALDAAHVVIGPVGVTIGPTYLIPDLVITRRDALPGRANLLPADVSLVVEIVSPGSETTDRVTKPAQYAAAGIEHYWRVETDPVSLTAYRLVGDTYAEVGTWAADQVARLTDPFAVTVDLARLLAG